MILCDDDVDVVEVDDDDDVVAVDEDDDDDDDDDDDVYVIFLAVCGQNYKDGSDVYMNNTQGNGKRK